MTQKLLKIKVIYRKTVKDWLFFKNMLKKVIFVSAFHQDSLLNWLKTKITIIYQSEVLLFLYTNKPKPNNSSSTQTHRETKKPKSKTTHRKGRHTNPLLHSPGPTVPSGLPGNSTHLSTAQSSGQMKSFPRRLLFSGVTEPNNY